MYIASPSDSNKVSVHKSNVGILSYNINLGSDIKKIVSIANGMPYFIVTCVDKSGNIINKKYLTNSGVLSSSQIIGKE